MGRVTIDQGALRMVLNMMRRAAERNNNPSLADAAAELEADAQPLPNPAAIPRELICEPCGDEVEGLRPGQAYREGWNDCVRKFHAG